jgi:IS1 family transposase
MVSDLIFYELLLVGLLWLCVMLHDEWRSDYPASNQRTSKPAKPPRKRSGDPEPFAGLTRKPHCAACEQAAQEPAAPPPPTPPPQIISTRGRPRQVDTSQHFCPDPDCAYRGRVGLGNISSNGHPNGGPWRQLYCSQCEGYFLETHGTIFYGKRVPVELIVRVLACLAEGLGIRATARVFEVDANTVLRWLIEAAEHLKAFSQYFLCDVHVRQIQLDELYALLSAVKDGEISEAKAIKRLSRSPHWVWVAIDPVTKLLLTVDVGPRTLAMAQCVIHKVVRVLAPDCVPLFLTDGYKDYITALLTHFGYWIQPERRQARGPMPKPRWMPLPQLLYAQVIKVTRRRRLVEVKHRVVFGTKAAVEQVLTACGWQINTAFIERVNLSIRQHVAAVGRRVMTLCKGEAGLWQQLVLYVPRLLQLLLAACELAPASPAARTDQWQRLGQALAAADAGDGSRPDRSHLDVA